MSYSTTEKREALLEFAQEPVTTPNQAARVHEHLLSLLVQEPDTLFLLLRYSVSQLRRDVAAARVHIATLASSAQDLSSKPQSINDLSSVEETARLLGSAESALSRGGSLQSPEAARISKAIKRSALDLTRNIRHLRVPAGASTTVREVGQSFDEAKLTASSTLRLLEAKYETIFSVLSNVAGALPDFLGSSILSKLGQKRVARAKQGVEELSDSLDALSIQGRSQIARSAALRLMAANVEIQDVAHPLAAGEPRIRQKPSGSPDYRITAAGTGTAPEVEGSISAPWPITDSGKTLTININGDTEAVDLLNGTSGVEAAELTGVVEGPFPIAGDLATPDPLFSVSGPFNITPTTDLFHFSVDGREYEIPLTNGGTVSASTIANDINTDPAVIANPWITASVVVNVVRLDYSNPSPPADYSSRIIQILSGPDDAVALKSFTPGDRSTGWDANNVLKIQPNDRPSTVDVTLTSGSWPTYLVAASTVQADIDSAASAAGEDFAAQAVGNKIRIYSTISGEGSIITIRTDGKGTTSERAAQTLGFDRDQEDRREDVQASTVVTALKGNSDVNTGAKIKTRRVNVYESSAEVSSSTQFQIDVDGDPTSDWPSLSSLKLALESPDGFGIYGVSAASVAAGVLTITVNRRIRDAVATLCWISIYSTLLRIESRDDSTDGIIQMSGTPVSVLGLDTTAHRATVQQLLVEKNDSLLGWKKEELLGYHIRAFDLITEDDESLITTVSEVDTDNGLLTVGAEVSADFTRSTAGFTVNSASAVAYTSLSTAIASWLEDQPTNRVSTLRRAFARLYVAKSLDASRWARQQLTDLDTALSSIEAELEAYEPPQLTVVEQAINSLLEAGQDRARSLLVAARVSDYVNLTSSLGSTVEALRVAAAEVMETDLGEMNKQRRNMPRTVWIDALDPNRDFSDFEDELEEFYEPDFWGDEEL